MLNAEERLPGPCSICRADVEERKLLGSLGQLSIEGDVQE